MIHKIGIISDTHGMLRLEVLENLQGCEYILHGGDINKQEILDELGKIAPVYVVRGNNDKDWAVEIPETLQVEICGLRIFMIHNKKFIPKEIFENPKETDLILYGHSHKYDEKPLNGIVAINPGSCGPRRFNQEITMAILYVEEGTYRIEKVLLPHNGSKVVKKEPVPADLAGMLPKICKDISDGKTIKQLMRKYHISEELSDQINRMYLTHPGLDVDGMMRRLGEKFDEYR